MEHKTKRLFKSIDGGQTWLSQEVSQFGQGFFRSIFAYNDSIVWAVGNGKILFTENGGLSNVELLSSEIPENFTLYQNYPNPFNPKTQIKFEVKNSSTVKLEIFDLLGREVSILLNKKLQPGTYQIDFEMSGLNSGVYFYKLSTENFSKTMKMFLIK